MRELSLSNLQLSEILEAFQAKIAEGLAADDREIACLPTYMALPSGRQSGKALVVDTGGTNMRAAVVLLEPGEGRLLEGPVAKPVPDGRDGEALSGEDFFFAQAQLTGGFPEENRPLPLGYCFSYPARITPEAEAILLRWTKGLRVEGVVGQAVGKMLKESLQNRGIEIGAHAVLNDTVASLMGGAHLAGDSRYGERYIGLILGTGTNMAGLFSPTALSKVPSKSSMIVNLESGNFHPPHLSAFDEQVDAQSDNPGNQRLEKAISGHYLPQVFAQIHPEHPPLESSAQLVEIRDSESPESQTCAALLKRSAQLAAVGLAAVASFYDEGPCAVLAEGGLLWGDSAYVPQMKKTLEELVPQRHFEMVEQRENVNLFGAACAAL